MPASRHLASNGSRQSGQRRAIKGEEGPFAALSFDAMFDGLLTCKDYRGAITAIMGEYGPSVRGLLHVLYRKTPDVADDAFSLFAENLCRHIESFRGESTARTWTFRLARNAAVDVTRDPWRKRGRRLETSEAEELAQTFGTKSGLRLERQSRDLHELRESLSMDDQTLLTLRLDERLPWDDIAAIMSTDEVKVDAVSLRKRFERIKVGLAELARRSGLLE